MISSPKQDLQQHPEQVLPAALRYLGRREYTATELRRLLLRRGAATEAVDEAIGYLEERHYLDDERAALATIRQRQQLTPRGRQAVLYELRQRGIDNELAEQLLAEHYSPEQERALLHHFIAGQRLQPSADYAEQRRRWQKLARRAAAKGYDQELVYSELELWASQEPEAAADEE